MVNNYLLDRDTQKEGGKVSLQRQEFCWEGIEYILKISQTLLLFLHHHHFYIEFK